MLIVTGRYTVGTLKCSYAGGDIRLEAEGDRVEDRRSVNAIGALRRSVKLIEL
jgi:hypothetical protein